MSTAEKLSTLLSDYRNSIKKDLDKQDLQEVDKYIQKVIDDMAPMFKLISEISNDEDQLKDMKSQLDKIIQEEKWLEKLLRTS